MKKIITLLSVFAIVIVKAQPCPTFSFATADNFSVSCNTTISIINPVSTQTPPATVSGTFLPPGFSGVISPTGALGTTYTTLATVAGTWSLLVRDNANFCTTTQTVLVTGGPPFFTMTISAPNNSVNCNGTATINAFGNSGYSVSATQGTVNGNSITNLCPGYLNVCLTDTATGCKYCDSTIVSITTGLKQNENRKMMSVYPNPSQGYVSVMLSGSNQNIKVQVTNVLGNLVFERSYVSDEKVFQAKIDLQNEPSGIYFIRVGDGQKEYVKKIMISR
jgi:hypothetical protein